MLNRVYILTVIFLTIFSTFSYGQSSELGTVCAESRHNYGVSGFEGSTFTWAVEGGIIVQGDGEDTVLINWGYQTGTYQMEVVELTSTDCMGTPVMATVTVQAPEVDLGFDFYEICDGDSVIFDATGNYEGTPSYLWHDGSTNDFYIANSTENVRVSVTDGLGCVRSDSVEFTAHSLPIVNLGGDTLLCDDENPLELDAGVFASYEWITTTEDYIGNPVYLYPVYEYTDTVKVIVTDENGCQTRDTMLIFPCNVSAMFDGMSNTFTPDGDGQNETWVIIDEMHQFPNAVLEIFDRWGRLVYRTTNVATEPWDGTSKGREMPMDAYFFVLELNFSGMEPITGTVNLIK